MERETFKLSLAFLGGLMGVVALLLLSVGTSAAVRASGDVYYVAPPPTGDDGNPCTQAQPCATVQHAVDIAGTGAEIRVATGTYTDVHVRRRDDITTTGVVTQVVYISKTLTVRGGYTTTDWADSDPDGNPTTLDAQRQGRVLYISGDISPTIERLRITGGDATGMGGVAGPTGEVVDAGGGVYVISATTIISNCQVFRNSAPAGGGLLLYSSAAMVRTNIVTSNTASFIGGGLCSFNSDATLDGNTFTSNAAGGFGGGGLALLGGRLALHGDAVISNTAEGEHAAGGGLFVSGRSDATLINTVVAENWADGNGAALHVSDSSVNLLHTTIVHNTGGGGTGIHLHRELSLYTTVALTNTILASHTVAIQADESTTATLYATLWYANATDWSGNVTHTDDHTGNPAFAADGYHLTVSSAAIDKGVDASVDDDLDEEARPFGRPDLGADEWWGVRVYLPLILRNYP
jgi:hypothetical protein